MSSSPVMPSFGVSIVFGEVDVGVVSRAAHAVRSDAVEQWAGRVVSLGRAVTL